MLNMTMDLPKYEISKELKGHSNDVKCVFSSKNDLILSCSRDCNIISWKLTKKNDDSDSKLEFELSEIYKGHSEYVNSVINLKDRSQIVSGGSDSRILIHDMNRADKPVQNLLEHWNNVCCLHSNSNDVIISGSWDLTARVWKLNDRGNYEQFLKISDHNEAVWDVKLLDDETILTASADSLIRHFDKNGNLINVFKGHTEPVRSLALLSNERFASCSNDGTIRKWDLRSGNQLKLLAGHSSFIYSLDTLPSPNDDDYLVSCGEDYEIRIWLGETCLQTILIPSVSIWSVSSLPNSDFVVGASDNNVYLFTKDDSRKAKEDVIKEWENITLNIKQKQTGRSSINNNTNDKNSPISIEIDVDDNKPNLKFNYKIGDDLNKVSKDFVNQNDLPPSYANRIAQFVAQATGQPFIEMEKNEDKKAERETNDDFQNIVEGPIKEIEIESENYNNFDMKSIRKVADILTSNETKNVIVLCGAGISTNAGIPDFRSPKTGLYANLQSYNLPYPEAIFDIDYFRESPQPFYTLAKELYPGHYLATLTHYFIKLLELKGKLKRVFTQNIDTLERIANVSPEKIVECHGSFNQARCIKCKSTANEQKVKQDVMKSIIPKCENVECKNDEEAIIKPDITFFGESLPSLFFEKLEDLQNCDALIVIGTSLNVNPFASLINLVRSDTQRVLINLEKAGDHVGGFNFSDDPNTSRDILCLGKCDNIILKLSNECGWKQDLMNLYYNERQQKATEFKLSQINLQSAESNVDNLIESISNVKI